MKPASLDHPAAPWLALRRVQGVGPVVYRALLDAFGSPGAVLAARPAELIARGLRADVARAVAGFDDWQPIERQLQRLDRCGASLLTWADAAYPARLRQIHDPPPFLFVRGCFLPDDDLAVAVVGSREVGSYGRRMAREIARGLAQHRVTVVSGLARGTDAEAHAATLEAGGRTIAVLGSGVDVIYPREHHALAAAIVGHGALVSEFPLGAQPDAENFPARNRIISGMSAGVVVVEAAERSGSLITAHVAAEQGRDVFAVPGPVGRRTAGTHRLLRDGAKLTESAVDVLEEVAPAKLGQGERRRSYRPTPDEEPILQALGRETVHVDTVILRSGTPAAAVLPVLLGLELKGVVEQLPGKFFALRAVDLGPVNEQE